MRQPMTMIITKQQKGFGGEKKKIRRDAFLVGLHRPRRLSVYALKLYRQPCSASDLINVTLLTFHHFNRFFRELNLQYVFNEGQIVYKLASY